MESETLPPREGRACLATPAAGLRRHGRRLGGIPPRAYATGRCTLPRRRVARPVSTPFGAAVRPGHGPADFYGGHGSHRQSFALRGDSGPPLSAQSDFRRHHGALVLAAGSTPVVERVGRALARLSGGDPLVAAELCAASTARQSAPVPSRRASTTCSPMPATRALARLFRWRPRPLLRSGHVPRRARRASPLRDRVHDGVPPAGAGR